MYIPYKDCIIFLLVLSRLELETHPYQEYALPIKLKNFSRSRYIM